MLPKMIRLQVIFSANVVTYDLFAIDFMTFMTLIGLSFIVISIDRPVFTILVKKFLSIFIGINDFFVFLTGLLAKASKNFHSAF